MREIKRDYYLNQLISRRENGAVKIVTGVRRCGKSYLLFELFRNYLYQNGVDEKHIIALSLDEEKNRIYRNPEKLNAYIDSQIASDKEQYYVLLDEVQFAIDDDEIRGKSAPIRLYGVLNGLLRKRNVDIYITGSNSKFLSSDVMTEFRGRGDEVRLMPLSFAEFMSVYDGDKQDGYDEYSLYGGLPFVLTKKTDAEKARYLRDLFKSTYTRDVVERYKLRGNNILENLVDVLASDIGTLTNPNKLANTFVSNGIKTNERTIASYIEYLEDAFIITKAQRYDIKGKRYIGSPMKYYFSDMGLRNARLNFRQVEPTHLMENIIYNELLVRGYSVDVGIVESYKTDANSQRVLVRNEVDFVCNMGSKRYYIQSAFSIPTKEKMQQEEASLNRISDSFKKILVVQDRTKPWYNDNGYLIINLFDFLLNPNSMEI
ncbi:MAG: ATP-binding protein [Bacteroides sp.]|nr:ATP-binding protein [Bacillota bacterium]MCM1394058.1 ATP-binding protein [[Eubacterium] siraeum]MCM1455577.1 ATP-binding protein [Bacteroides sp.]